jgi:integrase
MRRYLRRYKDNCPSQERQLITVEDMARPVNSEMDIRNMPILALLAKTSIHRNELITLNTDDIDLIDMKIRRSNRNEEQPAGIFRWRDSITS